MTDHRQSTLEKYCPSIFYNTVSTRKTKQCTIIMSCVFIFCEIVMAWYIVKSLQSIFHLMLQIHFFIHLFIQSPVFFFFKGIIWYNSIALFTGHFQFSVALHKDFRCLGSSVCFGFLWVMVMFMYRAWSDLRWITMDHKLLGR